jgi:DNA-binding NtrC family response regulator
MKPGTRILILDDERIVCDRLSLMLGRLGFDVECCTDSQLAVDRLSSGHFDILVTDLKMPGIGGMDVLRFVRDQSPATKVIVITGFATTKTAKEVLASGAVEFIPKPFKMSYLRDLVVHIAETMPPSAEDETTARC